MALLIDEYGTITRIVTLDGEVVEFLEMKRDNATKLRFKIPESTAPTK